MHEFPFESEVIGADHAPVDVVRECVYREVRVTAEWSGDRIAVRVHGDIDVRNAPAYVELFFHDAFLLLNLSAPGSFGGTIATTGGELRVRKLTFNPRVFVGDRMPLDRVTAWYDALNLGTQQTATTPEAVALFQLLHLARSAEENEETSILRLAIAADALGIKAQRLFELRDEIAYGRAPVFHPMHDDALDPRVEDATREWIEVADEAAAAVIGELQARMRR